MKHGNRLWVRSLGVALLISATLAWNQRIPDPWGLYLILFSLLGFTVAVVMSARRAVLKPTNEDGDS